MKTVLFCAHNPGGANAIVPVVQALLARGWNAEGALAGPARDIFARKWISYTDFEEKSDAEIAAWVAQKSPDLYLAGTSVGMSLDKKILLLLKERVPSVYVLDYWNEYWQRFSEERKDLKYAPTLVCALDEVSQQELVREGFEVSRIAITGNPYFETFADTVSREGEAHENLLFVSQPLSETAFEKHFTSYGFNEFDALRGLIEALHTLPKNYELSIRPHPREDKHKFDTYLSDRIRLSEEDTLEESLSKAGLVIGMFSPVLFQAVLAGKSVVSYEPGLAVHDPLPSNRSGGTVLATTQEELTKALSAYANGATLGNPTAVRALFRKGSVEAILSQINRLVQEPSVV
ncbi:MAG: hypothetical protein WA058_00945 [Minisyncoccia bacterium]